MPGDFGDLAVNTRVHTHYPMRTRGCGCAWHPAFPTPSLGETIGKARVHCAARMQKCVAVIASSAMLSPPSFRDGPKDQTSDVQLHIRESRASPMCNCTSEVRCFASPWNDGG